MDNNLNIIIGKRIREIRLKKGYRSTLKFAKAYAAFLGEAVDDVNKPSCYQSLKKWESGIGAPNAENIFNLCAFFNCSSDYLFGFITEKSIQTHEICQKTGLSEESIEILSNWKSVLSGFQKYTNTEFDLTNYFYGVSQLTVLNELFQDESLISSILENIWKYKAADKMQDIVIKDITNDVDLMSGDQVREVYLLRIQHMLMEKYSSTKKGKKK